MQRVFVVRSVDNEEMLLVERRLQRELEDFYQRSTDGCLSAVVPDERINQTTTTTKIKK